MKRNLRRQAQKIQQKAHDLRNSGKEKEAIKTYKKAILLWREIGDKAKEAEDLQQIGVCYKIGSHMKKAIGWLKKSARIYQKINDKTSLGNVERDIGITYEYIKDYQKALAHLQKSAEYLRDSSDRAAYGITLSKIGLVLTETKKFQQAEHCLQEGLKEVRRTNYWFGELTTLLHFATLRYLQKRYDEMINFAKKAIGILKREKQEEIHTRRFSQAYGILALGYLGKGNFEKAVDFYQKSLKIALTFTPDVRTVVLEDIQALGFLKTLKKEGQNKLLSLLAQDLLDFCEADKIDLETAGIKKWARFLRISKRYSSCLKLSGQKIT